MLTNLKTGRRCEEISVQFSPPLSLIQKFEERGAVEILDPSADMATPSQGLLPGSVLSVQVAPESMPGFFLRDLI